MIPEFAWYWWLAGGLGAFCIGVAKTGVPGLGIFVVPIFALMLNDAIGSAGWLLPLLIVADIFAVAYHRRHAQVKKLAQLIPWVLVGMAVGGGLMAVDRLWLHSERYRLLSNALIGGLILTMVGMHVWRRWWASNASTPTESGYLQEVGTGMAAGLTTIVANAAGPVMNLYFLTKRFPKEQLIGTGAWFFLVVNTSKIPVYAPLGLFSAQSLVFDLLLVPGVILGSLVGKRIFAKLSQKVFEVVVLILAAIAAIVLMIPRSWWLPAPVASDTPTVQVTEPGQPMPAPGVEPR